MCNIGIGKATLVLPDGFAAPNTISFKVGEEEVLLLDEHGMTYKGQHIKDAGEAHKAFLEVLANMKAVQLTEDD